MKIFSVPAAGGEARLAIDQDRGVYSAVLCAPRAPVMIAGWGSSVNPLEIVRVDP